MHTQQHCILPSSRLAQLVERKTLNLVVVGSSPTVGAFSFSALAFQGPEVLFLACARACIQTECHSPLTLTLEGGCLASQTERGQLLWRSWQRVGLIIPRSRVRSSPGARLFVRLLFFVAVTYLLTAKWKEKEKTQRILSKKMLHVRELNPGRLRDRQKCYQLHQRG